MITAIAIGTTSCLAFGAFLWRLGRGMARLHDDMTRDTRQDN